MVAPFQTMHLGSYIRVSKESPLTKFGTFSHMSTMTPPHRLCSWGHLDDTSPRSCTWGYMCIVSMVTPHPPPQILSLESNICSIQGNPQTINMG